MEEQYVYMLTIDGTSNGEYENGATALLFKNHDEAVEYVNLDFIDCVVTTIDAELTDEEISAKIQETCKWYENDTAQFRYRDTIVDYKIEKVKIPH